MKYRIIKKRGVDVSVTAITLKQKGKKQPDPAATASLKKDKLAMVKIIRGRKEARTGKTHSWDSVFSD